MIYAGIINYGANEISKNAIIKGVASFSEDSPTLVCKNNVILCYGKILVEQDLDEQWENDSALLIGRAFHREESRALKKEEFKNVSLNQIWGKYVYFDTDKKTSDVTVVVDSSGQLPFFYYALPNKSILFSSDIEIIYKILGQKPEFNIEYLCSYLKYGNSSSTITPFKNVFEVPPACKLLITKNERKTVPFWNPLDAYTQKDSRATDAVNVLKNTLKPWVEPYKNVCVSLSGGLDSSSLMYCLKDVVRKDQFFTAINYYHSQIKSSNELTYARKVCEETGVKLIEIDASDSLPFDPSRRKMMIKPNKPCPGLVSLRWLEIIFEKVQLKGSLSFISGHGSDHIFMRPPSKKAVADYFLENGLKGHREKLNEVAQYYRDPLYSILKENIKALPSYYLGKRINKREGVNKLEDVAGWINQDVHQALSPHYIHPIYESLPGKILPGKYEQIDCLYEGLASIHVELTLQINPTYYPFLYQPVVDFALSHPTYNLFKNGYDRYPLRSSVSNTYNTQTVWRRDKSQTTGLFQQGLKNNLDSVLEICLDGHFVRQGLVDRDGLHKTINLIANGDIKNLWPFMYLVSSEMFIRQWET